MTLLELMLKCMNQSCLYLVRCKDNEDSYKPGGGESIIKEFCTSFCMNIVRNLLNAPGRKDKRDKPDETDRSKYVLPSPQILRRLKKWGAAPNYFNGIKQTGATIEQIKNVFLLRENVFEYLAEQSEYVQRTMELSAIYKQQKLIDPYSSKILITASDCQAGFPKIVAEFHAMEKRMEEMDIYSLLNNIDPELEKFTLDLFFSFTEHLKEADIKSLQIHSALIAALFMISITLKISDQADPDYTSAIQNILDCLRDTVTEIKKRPAVSVPQKSVPSVEKDDLTDIDAIDSLFSPFLKKSFDQFTEQKKIRYEKGKDPQPELLSEVKTEGQEKNPVSPSLYKAYLLFSSLMQEYIDPDSGVRILLSGNKVSGRTTQLLVFWKEILNKNASDETTNKTSSPETAVLYVPADNLKRSNMSLLNYIGHVYFPEEFRRFRNNREQAYDRIIDILQTISEKKKIFFFMDDCDLLSEEDMSIFETLFIEGNMLRKINVITTARTSGFEWNNVQKMSLIGIPDKNIISVLSRYNRNISPDDPVFPHLKSPWFLKLYLNYPIENNPDTSLSEIGFSVSLIHESLERRIHIYESKHTVKNRISSDVIRFSMNELLPRITINGVLEKYQLKRQLTGQLTYLSKNKSFFIEHEYDQNLFKLICDVLTDPDNAYILFIRKPLITILDLLHPGKKTRGLRGPGREPLLWNETVIENYFHAYGLCQLLFADQTSDSVSAAINQLHNYADSMIRYYNADEHSPDGHSGYDRSCFFLELLQENEVERLCVEHAEVMFLLFAGISMICDSHGDEAERYQYATLALNLVQKGDFREDPDPSLICTMAYFIIKYDPGDNKPDGYDAQKQTAFQKLEEMLLQDFDPILKSNIHSNIGAYYQRSEEPDKYDKAQEHYDESLRLRKAVYDGISYEAISEDEKLKKKNRLLRSLRRCYVQQATNAYYKHEWERSIKFHQKALEIGEEAKDPRRYESYSRLVGTELGKRDIKKKDTKLNQADAKYLLELLTHGIKIMKESRCINRKELKNIHNHAVVILDALKRTKYAYNEEYKKWISATVEQISGLFYAYVSDENEKLTNLLKEVLK